MSNILSFQEIPVYLSNGVVLMAKGVFLENTPIKPPNKPGLLS